jgi:hypothetical protein
MFKNKGRYMNFKNIQFFEPQLPSFNTQSKERIN